MKEESDLKANHLRLLNECEIAKACLVDEEFERVDSGLHKSAERAGLFQLLQSSPIRKNGPE
jgi:hypothetical protein